MHCALFCANLSHAVCAASDVSGENPDLSLFPNFSFFFTLGNKTCYESRLKNRTELVELSLFESLQFCESLKDAKVDLFRILQCFSVVSCKKRVPRMTKEQYKHTEFL